MTAVSRIPAWGWCLACLVLAGCCTTKSSCSTCTAAVASNIISNVPSTYDNYTPPPQPKLIPAPADDPLISPPPPPATKYDPHNKVIDYFESATDRGSQHLSR